MDVPFIGLLAELPAIGWSGVVRSHGSGGLNTCQVRLCQTTGFITAVLFNILSYCLE